MKNLYDYLFGIEFLKLIYSDLEGVIYCFPLKTNIDADIL